MKELTKKLNANVSIKKVSKNGRIYRNIIVTIPTEKEVIDFEVRLAFSNAKLLYKISKNVEGE